MWKAAALGSSAALLLGGCGWGVEVGDDRPRVVVGFYPLEYAAERIAGDLVTITSLAKPGADAHDLELTARDLIRLSKARVVFYEKGFQPALDDAVAQQTSGTAVDIAAAADLALTDGGGDHGDATHDDEVHDDEVHEEGHAADGAPVSNGHFWLDPHRFSDVVTAMGSALASSDPANAAAYDDNTAALVGDLQALDQRYRRGLSSCASRELVTGHAAFAYLAQRYDLHALSVAGLSPEAEPDAATLRDLTERVRDSGVDVVFAEPLTSPALTEALATETGARVELLDPAEGIAPSSLGTDYLEIMDANLTTLRTALDCP